VLRACGRGPTYSGKFIARAVELYLKGVKPGYIRWDELQSTLEKEFPGEFKAKGEDKPSPETVLDWVRKRPDAPEQLKQLRVQEATPGQIMSGIPLHPFSHQAQPPVPIPYASVTSTDIAALFSHFIALMTMAIMVRFTWSLART
jgi:hypothetical protein